MSGNSNPKSDCTKKDDNTVSCTHYNLPTNTSSESTSPDKSSLV